MATRKKRKVDRREWYEKGCKKEEYSCRGGKRHGRFRTFNIHETISYSDTIIVNGVLLSDSKSFFKRKSVLGQVGFNAKDKKYGQCLDFSATNKQDVTQFLATEIENTIETFASDRNSVPAKVASRDKNVLLIEDACEILHLARSTVYGKCQKGLIPHSKPGKFLYFNKEELLKYSQTGGNKTKEEIDKIADELLSVKKKTRK